LETKGFITAEGVRSENPSLIQGDEAYLVGQQRLLENLEIVGACARSPMKIEQGRCGDGSSTMNVETFPTDV
jgi:hypothetical protein